jgi:hypothetical protein
MMVVLNEREGETAGPYGSGVAWQFSLIRNCSRGQLFGGVLGEEVVDGVKVRGRKSGYFFQIAEY